MDFQPMRSFACLSGLFFLSLAPLGAQNTGSIQGQVILQSSGDPLEHVVILVSPLGRSVETDENGRYAIRALPPGRYELVAHMHFLTSDRETVVLEAGQSAVVDFRMKIETVRERVTVTASGKEEVELNTFQPTTSLDRTDLTSQTATSLGEVLEGQAGVAKRSSGPGTTRPVIRGFDGDRVLIMQDGVRTGSLSSQSGDHGEPIDPNSVERVEVVRGPSTLLYEGNAIGGVVNVIGGHHQIHKEPHDGLRGSVTGVIGSNNYRRAGSGSFEYGRKHWLLFGDGGTVHLGEYHAPSGLIPNSQSRVNNSQAGIGHYADHLFFNASYGYREGAYGIPFSPEETGHEEISLPFRLHNLRFNGGLRNTGTFLEQFQLSLNYSDWQHREQEEGEVANRFFNKQFVYRGVFDQQQRGRLSGSFGFWGLHRDYKAIGEEAITPPVKQNAVAFFGVEQVNLERVRLQFGARLEHSRYNPLAGPDRSFTGVAASAGANVRLWRNGAFVASFASSFRPPALEELYANGPHAGNLVFEVGDPQLRNERGNGLDLSLRHQTPRFRAEGSFFYYRLSDYVYLAPTGEMADGFPVTNYRQGASRYRGFEGRLSTGLRNDLWLHLGIDTVNAELLSPVLPLPRIPPVRGRIGIEARHGAFSLMPELLLSHRQDRVYPLEDPTAGYAAVNVKALYSLTSRHLLHLFGFELFNAGDRLYRNHLSFIKDFAPEIGRGVMASYTLRFF